MAGARGASVASVANQFGVSERSLERHLDSHPRARPTKKPRVPTARASKVARAPLPRSDKADESPATSRSPSSQVTARAKLDELLVTLKKIADEIRLEERRAEEEDGRPLMQVGARLALLKASVAPIRLLGQLTGELGASDTTVASSPHYRRIRVAIIEALAPFPDALKAVEVALTKLEPGSGSEDIAA